LGIKTEEDLFRALPGEAVTIKIGLSGSIAKHNLRDRRDVARLMGRLVREGTQNSAQDSEHRT
jgi:hypothetical protein